MPIRCGAKTLPMRLYNAWFVTKDQELGVDEPICKECRKGGPVKKGSILIEIDDTLHIEDPQP